jgi:phospholipid/cholesterol/gamma-HCH transport system ATP-binding protein
MSASTSSFSNVTIGSSVDFETGLSDVSFDLRQGNLFLLRMERENERLPLADVMQGLVEVESGSVSFLGERWIDLPTDLAAAQRGRIGRLFDDEGWISDLDVEENILLAQLHHTKRSEAEIVEEALGWARIFGLPGLPRGRADKVRRWDLRKAACIRAFLGRPELIIIEQPVRGLYADLIAPLLNAVKSARRRGAAVLWMVTDPQIWKNVGMHATFRARMRGAELQMEGTS